MYGILIQVSKLKIKTRYSLMSGYGIPLVFIGISHLIFYFTKKIYILDNENPKDYY